MEHSNEEDFKYWAFISYSHEDASWGDWLHKTIETYHIPKKLIGRNSRDGKIPKRLFPVFRDREELPTSSNLGATIDNALKQSRYLVVICSPNSANSRWVGEEIKLFKKMGKADRILCLIVDGEPNVSDKPESKEQECFHKALRYQIASDGTYTEERVEAIAADSRTGKDSKKAARLKLIAGLLGVNFDELFQRDKQRRRRQFVLSTLAVCLLLGIVGGLLFQSSTKARISTETEQSRILAEKSFEQTDTGNTELGVLLALEALPKNFDTLDRGYAAEAEAALYAAMHNYRQRKLLLRGSADQGGYFARILPGSHRAVSGNEYLGWITLWNIVTGTEIKQFKGESDYIKFSISSDGQVLASSATTSGEIVIIDTDNGEVKQTLPTTPRRTEIYLNRDGSRLLLGTSVLWDTEKAAQLAILSDTAPLKSDTVNFSPDGSKIFAATDSYTDRKLFVWDSMTGLKLHTIDNVLNRRESILWFPDGKRIFARAYVSDEVYTPGIWNADTGEKIIDLEVDVTSRENYGKYKVSADGSFLYALKDNKLRIWDAATGKQFATTHIDYNPKCHVSPEGKRYICNENESIKVLDISAMLPFDLSMEKEIFDDDRDYQILLSEEGERDDWGKRGNARLWISKFESQNPKILDSYKGGDIVNIAADGSRFIEEKKDYYYLGEALAYSTPLQILPANFGSLFLSLPRLFSFSADGRFLLAPRGEKDVMFPQGEKAVVWDTKTWQPVFTTDKLEEEINTVAFSPDGTRLLLSLGEDFSIGIFGGGGSALDAALVWDMETKTEVLKLEHDDAVIESVYSPDGNTILTITNDRLARLWDAETGSEKFVLNTDPYAVYVGVYNPDGTLIATSSSSEELKKSLVNILVAETGQVKHSFTLETKMAYSLAFSPDGTRLLGGFNGDGAAHVWDVNTGNKIHQLGHDGSIIDVDYSANGHFIATSAFNGSIKIWDAETGDFLRGLEIKAEGCLISFSPDSHLLLIGCVGEGDNEADNTLMDVTTGRVLANPITATTGKDRWVDFSPDGKTFLISSDGAITIWKTLPHGQQLIELARKTVSCALTKEERELYGINK
jgi:WD40 repeat protein